MAGLRSCCLPPCAGSPAFCLTWHSLMLFSSKPTLSLSSRLHLQSQQPSDGSASAFSHLLNGLLLCFLVSASSSPSSLSSPCGFLTLSLHFPLNKDSPLTSHVSPAVPLPPSQSYLWASPPLPACTQFTYPCGQAQGTVKRNSRHPVP